jgi:hypothetical protein
MRRTVLIISFSLLVITVTAQQTITVHFLHGSKPAKGYKNSETKWFGGIKGGHVTIEAGDSVVGFQPGGKCHLFPKTKYGNGYFSSQEKVNFLNDTASMKYTSIIIPLSKEQYAIVKQTIGNYLTTSPYDYAVFGMRCAAAAYDVLEDCGVVKKRSRFGKWASYFYPKLLRRKLLKLAKENNYSIVKNNGRKSRKWEKE